MMTPEGWVKKGIEEYLDILGIYAWRNNTGRRGKVSFGKVGSSDIIGIFDARWPDYAGHFLAIEVKAPGEKATLEQLQFLAEIAKRGGVAFVATSVEDVIEHLRRARCSKP
jgi:hypothetical protein